MAVLPEPVEPVPEPAPPLLLELELELELELPLPLGVAPPLAPELLDELAPEDDEVLRPGAAGPDATAAIGLLALLTG